MLSPFAIENGHLRIIPLGRSDGSPDADAQLSSLAQVLVRHFVHFFGGDNFHAEARLDPDEGYGRRLGQQQLVAFPPAVWRSRDYAFTLVHAVDPNAPDASTLALHLFPADWRFPVPRNDETKRAASRRRTVAKQIQQVKSTGPGRRKPMSDRHPCCDLYLDSDSIDPNDELRAASICILEISELGWSTTSLCAGR